VPRALVVPSEIPWKDLTGNGLEEALYWLVHSMGAKDLEWRQGSAGSGATDGGRDLKARFHVPTPDGQIRRETWWFEAKGRSKTVEPAAVKGAVVNAAGRNDVDVLVIATNVVFSNPTHDWVTDWQSSHPRPIVRLWSRHDLERQFCERPEVVIRLFAKALSPQGKLEVVRSRFWNYQTYAGEPLLEELWRHRHELQWSDSDIIAVLVSECANGSVTRRPWATLVSKQQRLPVLVSALTNILYFCFRADDAGVSQRPYIDGSAYLLLCCLESQDWQVVSKALAKIWTGKKKDMDVLRAHALRPVLETLRTELRDVCTDDCRRVSTDPLALSKDNINEYWLRLRFAGKAHSEHKRERLIIMVEKEDELCKVGFKVGKHAGCPIVRVEPNDDTPLDISKTLETLSAVVHKRAPGPS
jgi:hypothetical protein